MVSDTESTVYKTTSRDFLYRARQRLDEETFETLFYAAFELRCGIEARLQEYLSVQDKISEKKKKGWRIAQLASNIEQVFNIGDKIARIAIHNRDDSTILHEFYYTPVNSKLRKMGERLGDYMHVSKVWRFSEGSWWSDTRTFLEEVHSELKKANVGTMLGVPLREPGTNQIRFVTEQVNSNIAEDVLVKIPDIGSKLMIHVSYLDDIPDS